MPCYNPLSAWRVEGKIVFNPPPGSVGLLKPFNLPCSKCIGCRMNYARSWALRCQLEAQSHEDNCFITLTFNNENLLKRKNPWSVDVNDFQLFMKKFRKRFNKQIRFFHCGEYGEKTFRPHYHALIFGHDFRISSKNNTVKKYGSDKYPLYESTELTALWGKGHTTVGQLNFDTASYTARYITKKIKGDVTNIHIDPQTGEVSEIAPVYCTMSRGREPGDGIGARAFNIFKHNWYGNDYIVNDNGIKMKPPRYFDKLYAEQFPKKFEAIKKARKDTLDYLDMDPRDPKTKRLKDIENVKLLKLKECLREIDA